ncbi:hypothetical protein [Streptomyces sp. NPDC058953]|uniref:hypothetical protein n=1 Tax=unclassified Streptomyces TaxID=2593676 RepID=UPI0036A0E881
MADSDFYTHDRPPEASLPEDRPRGTGRDPAGPKLPHSTLWRIVVVVLAIIVVICFGIILFP